MTRDELQGVIGHEFSHILNGDMRLNLRLMGVIFGIVSLDIRVYHPFDSEDVLERLRLNFAEGFADTTFLNRGKQISVLPMWWAL